MAGQTVLDTRRPVGDNRAMTAPPPPASHTVWAALVAAVVAVAVTLATGHTAASKARSGDRKELDALKAENDRLRGIVETQADTIRRYEAFLAGKKD